MKTGLRKRTIKKQPKYVHTPEMKKERIHFRTVERQRLFMDNLATKFQLTSIQEWWEVQKIRISENGGHGLLYYTYGGDMKLLLSTIYPEYEWDFTEPKPRLNSFEYFKQSNENQREFMNNLYRTLKMQSLDDWLMIFRQTIEDHGGASLLKLYPDMRSLLTSVYPNWTFGLDLLESVYTRGGITTREERISISNRTMKKYGGQRLLAFYENDIISLLSKFYPLDEITAVRSKSYLRSAEFWRSFMDSLYIKFNLSCLDDWLEINKSQIVQNGGKRIFTYFADDMQSLLLAVYPDHPWNFSSLSSSHHNNDLNYDNSNNIDDIQNRSDDNHDHDVNHGDDSNDGELQTCIVDSQIDIHNQNNLSTFYNSTSINDINYDQYNFIHQNDNNDNDNNDNYVNNHHHHHNHIDNNNTVKIISEDGDFFLAGGKLEIASFDTQRQFVERILIHHFGRSSPKDLASITEKMIIDHGGETLLEYYSNNAKKMISTLFPAVVYNKATETLEIVEDQEVQNFYSLKYQREWMNHFISNLQLNSLDDLHSIRKRLIGKHGGVKLLRYYGYDVQKALSSIYPNYPWRFPRKKISAREFFKSLENQRRFMDHLFHQLKLRYMKDWLQLPKFKFYEHGARNLLSFYANDIQSMLSSIYPNYCWDHQIATRAQLSSSLSSSQLLPQQTINDRSIEFHRKVLEDLFYKFDLKYLDDWLDYPLFQIVKGGAEFIKYYGNDKKLMLQTIYPHYPWQSLSLSTNFNLISNQKLFVNNLMNTLKISSLEEFRSVPRSVILNHGGEELLKYYSNNMDNLISSIFAIPRVFSVKYFQSSIDHQRSFMQFLFRSLNLSSLDDWKHVSKFMFLNHSGKNLLHLYSGDISKLLISIYPNYPPCNFVHSSSINNTIVPSHAVDTIVTSPSHISTIHHLNNNNSNVINHVITKNNKKMKKKETKEMNEMKEKRKNDDDRDINIMNLDDQRSIMNSFFRHLGMKTFQDWCDVSKKLFSRSGGKKLLDLYSDDWFALIRNVYPNYPWSNEDLLQMINRPSYLRNIKYQREIMNVLFHIENMRTLEDWLSLSKHTLKRKRTAFAHLLKYYSDDIYLLLSTLYPNYPWTRPVPITPSPSLTQSSNTHDTIPSFDLPSLLQYELQSSSILDPPPSSSSSSLLIGDSSSINNESSSPHVGNDQNPILKSQRRYLDRLYYKLRLKNLEDWLHVARYKFPNPTGTDLLQQFSNNILLLCSTHYPNFPWHHIVIPQKLSRNNNDNKNEKKQNNRNNRNNSNNSNSSNSGGGGIYARHREKMEEMFITLKLITLSDFLTISRRRFRDRGGHSLLKYYNEEITTMLEKIYPNFPWSALPTDANARMYRSISSQRKFVDHLSEKLQLQSVDDWLYLSKKTLSTHCRKLLEFYDNDLRKLLTTIYPEHKFNFNDMKIRASDYMKSDEYQRLFLEQLFHRFQLQKLSDWINTPRYKFIENGASSLLKLYSDDLEHLLTSLYPNYPWDFSTLKYTQSELKHLPTQRRFMDRLFRTLQFVDLADWLRIPKYKLLNHHCTPLFQLYSDDLPSLLRSIYPNYPWSYMENFIAHHPHHLPLSDQYALMDKIFKKLHFHALDDWLTIPKSKFIAYGGRRLLSLYDYDFYSLLSSLYPSHPWNFPLTPYKLEYFKSSIDHQRSFIEQLFSTLNLTSLDDWCLVSKAKIAKHGGVNLLRLYSNDLPSLFRTLYPSHSWRFPLQKDSDITLMMKEYVDHDEFFKSFHNQRLYLCRLFQKLRLRTMQDWTLVAKYQILKVGGRSLLRRFSYDLQMMLSTIYPNYPWNFDTIFITKGYFKTEENQKRYMSILFRKLKLKNLADWTRVSASRVRTLKGGLLLKYYGSMENLLLHLYPNFPWAMETFQVKYVDSLEYQRKFMRRLFHRLQLRSLDDWMSVSINRIVSNGGKRLLKYYHSDKELMLTSIYPDHLWKFDSIQKNPSGFFKSIHNQRKFMYQLYDDLGLQSLDDWMQVTNYKVMQHGGSRLLYYYKFSMKRLLQAIYPHYHFRTERRDKYAYLKSISEQRLYISQLYEQLGLSSLDEWVLVPKYQITDLGGRGILRHYSNSVGKMLSTIYPNYPKANFFQSYQRIIHYMRKYGIRQKKDWYRISYIDTRIVSTLTSFYPEERWDASLYQYRNKKSVQRLLLIAASSLFPSHHLLENYKHPSIIMNSYPLEYDIFLPSLNLGIEYQGEQHFDEISGFFNYIQAYIINDSAKISLSRLHRISLIHIPYWWDGSNESLLVSVESKFISDLYSS